jgi:hypothetical protein
MTAPHADQLIDGYLARLRVAATDLPSSVRDELIADMRAHITEARSREAQETDATILNILDRLGEPDTVVAEAGRRPESFEANRVSADPAYRPGILEIAALVLLPLFWIIGVILLWVSPAWKTKDKVIGSLFSLGGYPGIGLIFFIGAAFGRPHVFAVTSGGNSCSSGADSAGNIAPMVCTGVPAWEVIGTILRVAFIVVVLLLPVMTSAYLAIRLRWDRRAQAAATLSPG